MNRKVIAHCLTNTHWLIPAALCIVALVIRSFVASLGHVLQGDESAYLWLGRTMVTGGGYQFFGRPELHYPPLYPLVSGVAWLLTKDMETASKACFVVFGTLTIAPVYALATHIYGRPTGYLAAGLIAVAPAVTSHIYFWGSMTEPLYFFLVFSGLYLGLLGFQQGRWWSHVGAGALFSLAYLTRPEGMIYLVLLVACILLRALIKKETWRWRAWRSVGVVVLVFAMIALPYLVFLRMHLGQWSLTGKTWIAYQQQRALMGRDLVTFDRISWGLDSTRLEVMYHSMEKFAEQHVLRDMLAHPDRLVSDALRNARQVQGVLLSRQGLPLLSVPLLGLGMFGSLWFRRRLCAEFYLLVMTVAPMLAIIPVSLELRFYLGSVVVLMVWVAHGVVELGRWVGLTVDQIIARNPIAAGCSGRWTNAATGVFGACLILCFVAGQPSVVRDGLLIQRFHYKAIGQWLHAHTDPDAIVMSRGAIAAVYAERSWVPFPHASYDEVMRYARALQVDYLVVNRGEFEAMRPQLAFLSDPALVPAALRPVAVHHGPQGATIVYQLLNESAD